MAQPPSDQPIYFDRSQLGQPPKKSSSIAIKILLAVFGSGLLVFTCCAGWLGYSVYVSIQQARHGNPEKAARVASGEESFDDANLKIVVTSGSAARGNSEEARKLAERFSTDIQTMREIHFTKRKKEPLVSLSQGKFLTYCRLDGTACVFLVHVPDLRNFNDEAKSAVAELAWATAQHVVRSNLENPPSQVAVGTRGVMLYDRVLIGSFQPNEEDESDGITLNESGDLSKKHLYPFFKAKPAIGVAGATGLPASDVLFENDGQEGKPGDGASANSSPESAKNNPPQ